MIDYTDVFNQLDTALAHATAQGYTPMQCTTLSRTRKECCAIGAAYIDSDTSGYSVLTDYFEHSGLDPEDISFLILGFDDPIRDIDHPYFRVGQVLAWKWVSNAK